MATLVHGDFEWDADKAAQNLANHDVTFEEAALAMTDPLSIDFDDLAQPQNVVTLATAPSGLSCTLSALTEAAEYGSSALGKQRPMNGESTKKATEKSEPSATSLAEMPEINDERFRRRSGRGHHQARNVGEIVAIDTDVWPHFGSQKAVNDALRSIIEESQR